MGQDIQILHLDQRFAVCVKPVGVDSEKQLPALLAQQCGGVFFPIHRLDLNVGGVMLFATSRQSAAVLSRAMQERQIAKEYVALVHGTPPERGEWEDLLFKDSRQNKVFVVKRMRNGVKAARLTYERLSAGEISAVRVQLHTGRSHQIRVQFASRGFALVGDHKYGARDSETVPRLFCSALRFTFAGEDFCFRAAPWWETER